VFVTHDQEEALEIADEVVVMNNARIEQVGTPQEVYDRPASPFVYQFLGNVNVLRAQALAGAGVPGANPAALEAEGNLYVRPHDVAVAPHDPRSPGLVAVLRYIHAAGPQARLTLEQIQSRATVEVEVSRSELATLGLKVGDLATLRLRQGRSFDADYAI
jgi:sulfate transport system ATP-binding protein